MRLPCHVGQGNLSIHSRKEQRYRCQVCGTTFTARSGTVFYRRRTPEAIITQVLTLVSYGCAVVAIEAAFHIHAQTVREWIDVARTHAEAVHHEQVVHPRDLRHVQADELRLQTQCGVIWMALALMVSTRLWLGGVISTRRDQTLIDQLVQRIAACAVMGPLLVAVDGLRSYIDAIRRTFRFVLHTGHVGQPHKLAWPDLVIGQVVKQRDGAQVVGMTRRLVQGTVAELVHLLWQTPGCVVLNTAYIERLNGTFRARLAVLARRTHHLAHRKEMLHASMYLLGTVYNFCSEHGSLAGANGHRQTPAMAAGITDHCWTVQELVHYRVAPPPWAPPKQGGQRSKELQQLVHRWAR